MRQRDATAEDRLHKLLALNTLLARVASEIGPALELEPVLNTVLRAMRSLVEFRGGTIQLLDKGGLFIAASDPAVEPELTARRIPVGTGLGGRVVTTGKYVYSPDVHSDERVDRELLKVGSNVGMRSYLAVPLVVLGRIVGILQIDSAEVDAFDTDDLAVLSGLATQVAGAIESARHNEEVMELERLKSDFLARVSHELRTPLTIVGGFLNTLISNDEKIEPRQRLSMLGRIEAATERLASLVDELLSVTQFEAGALEPQARDVAVAELLSLVRERAVEPELVTVRCPPDLHLRVDPRLLSHALGLLVDNALKYAGDAELWAGVGDDGLVYIEVRDHGPGIPPELGERVFERFMRGDHTEPGMGLGLPLVRTLAIGLNADCRLVHPAGGGAAFRLTFAAP